MLSTLTTAPLCQLPYFSFNRQSCTSSKCPQFLFSSLSLTLQNCLSSALLYKLNWDMYLTLSPGFCASFLTMLPLTFLPFLDLCLRSLLATSLQSTISPPWTLLLSLSLSLLSTLMPRLQLFIHPPPHWLDLLPLFWPSHPALQLLFTLLSLFLSKTRLLWLLPPLFLLSSLMALLPK